MQGIGSTVRKLRAFRARFREALAQQPGLSARRPDTGSADRLRAIEFRGENPGNLRMYGYVPASVSASCPLVVVLHGCTQNAAGFDHGTGWSALAEEQKFAVLFPGQQPANNPNNCFNWFSPEDTRRGGGEARSIHAMIEQMIADHGVDARRVYITGLSAGGAMAASMLAAYPEVFAGGAIVAGLPHGGANNLKEAFQSMGGGRARPAGEWVICVRGASGHAGSWPRVSVWHGAADTIVSPANAGHIVAQWLDVHGLRDDARVLETRDGYSRGAWMDASGNPLVELHEVPGMGHGVPLAPRSARPASGNAGPFLLDVGIPSTELIAESWGLREAPASAASESAAAKGRNVIFLPGPAREKPSMEEAGNLRSLKARIESVINKALASAGLLK